MKKFQVLLSILKMDELNYIDSLKITGDAVVVNQCDEDETEDIKRRSVNGSDQAVKYVKTTQRGLSRSRNMAIENADADICILCDNDVVYEDDYEKLIIDEFDKRKDADIIVFYIKRKEKPVPNFPEPRVMNYLSVLKIFSPEIAFRRENVADLKFNEDFGAGSGKYIMGEENIFLYDALKAGKKVYYVPVKIAELKEVESTWFSEYNEKFFISRGANYGAMSKFWSHVLIWQFALRKTGLYKDKISMMKAVKCMYQGRREYLKSSRIFVVGDHKTGTGPANVTKEYIRCLPKGTLFQKRTSKIGRLPELYFNILRSDIVFFSGYSAQNVIGMKFAKKLHKPTAYLVHGAIDHENSINHDENAHMSDIESKTLELADCLLAVSKRFSEWMKNNFPQYADKIDYVTNGIDERTVCSASERDMTKILSIGGGMPRKMILHICEGIEKIRETDGRDITLYVIGKNGFDTEAINKYPFVKNLGLVPAGKKEELFNECGIFIQNSCFETFGLAPVETLCGGMSVLCSKVCGVLDLFKSADEHDIINDYSDPDEIAEKITYIMNNPNREKLLGDIDFNSMSWEARTKELISKLKKIECR